MNIKETYLILLIVFIFLFTWYQKKEIIIPVFNLNVDIEAWGNVLHTISLVLMNFSAGCVNYYQKYAPFC